LDKNPNLANAEATMVSLVGVGIGLPRLHFHPPERHGGCGLGDSAEAATPTDVTSNTLKWVVARMSHSEDGRSPAAAATTCTGAGPRAAGEVRRGGGVAVDAADPWMRIISLPH